MTENYEDINGRAFWGTLGIVSAALFGLGILALALFLSAKVAPAGPFWRSGQLAQVDPADREWLKAQRSPNGVPCCDEADGVYAREDIRGDHYWVRFVYGSWVYPPGRAPQRGEDHDSDWMQVPDEVVIHNPNRHGSPVVWWVVDGTGLRIRCYAPGAGL